MIYRASNGFIFDLNKYSKLYFDHIGFENYIQIYGEINEHLSHVIEGISFPSHEGDELNNKQAVKEGLRFTAWLYDMVKSGAPAGCWNDFQHYSAKLPPLEVGSDVSD
ncbi:MAG: hypothetical protein KO464_02375 [Candidatus Methanofastidiosum sp.]|nr:hypothetical protein [Methanofastidiosum sp.]